MQPHAPIFPAHLIGILLVFYGFFLLIGLTAVIIPLCIICKKAGFSPWLAFLTLVFPIGGMILLYVLAFADWKVVPAPQAFWPPQPPYPPPQPPAAPQS